MEIKIEDEEFDPDCPYYEDTLCRLGKNKDCDRCPIYPENRMREKR